MTTLDFSPLLRASIGFDRLTRLLEDAAHYTDSGNGYPPYNIEKTGENAYRITLAIAGFGAEDVAITVHENVLVIEGQKKEDDRNRAFLYRGIAGRAFKRQFQLADHVLVESASLVNGVLTVDLKREIPEAMKPRRIPIATEPRSEGNVQAAGEAPEAVEGGRAAA